MMNEQRRAVMTAVLEGRLSADHVTMEEIKEVEALVFELVADRLTPFETFETIQ